MTTIAPPLRRRAAGVRELSRRRPRRSRQQVAALRGTLSQVAVIVLTIPAHLSLVGQATESATIAAGTAFGIAGLLTTVLAASIWQVARSWAVEAGIVVVVTLASASLLQLYASLALLWSGTSGLADFEDRSAVLLAMLGLGLLAMALLTARLEAAPVVTALLILAGLSTLAAVFPPGWHPRISDGVVALTLGQLALIGWLATKARPARDTPVPPPTDAPGEGRDRSPA